MTYSTFCCTYLQLLAFILVSKKPRRQQPTHPDGDGPNGSSQTSVSEQHAPVGRGFELQIQKEKQMKLELYIHRQHDSNTR